MKKFEEYSIKAFSLEMPASSIGYNYKKTAENYDKMLSNYACFIKTNNTTLSIEDNGPNDSDLFILDVSSTSTSKLNQFENWNSNMTTFTEIIRQEEDEFNRKNPGKNQPERVLTVWHLNEYEHLNVPWDDRFKIAKTQLDKIQDIKDALRFIDAYAHIYNESYFYFHKMQTIELLSSKSINEKDLEMLKSKSKEEADEWIVNFRLNIRKINNDLVLEWMEMIKNNVKVDEKKLVDKYIPSNVDCKLFTMCKRLNLPQNVDYDDLYFNGNIDKTLTYNYKFWHLFDESYEPSLFNLLEQATKLLGKIFCIENEWLAKIEPASKELKSMVKNYLKNVILREVERKFFHTQEKIFQDLNSRTDQACFYLDSLADASRHLMMLFLLKQNFHFLPQDQKIIDYIDLDMNTNKNEQYLLIYHSQALILKMSNAPFVFKRIVQTLENLFDIGSKIRPKVKFLFIDYDLHSEDFCGEQLFKRDFFHQNIHFDLYGKKFDTQTISQKETIDISFRFLPGVPDLNLMDSNVKKLDISKNFLVSIDMYNFRLVNFNLKTLLLNQNFLTHTEWNTFEKMKSLDHVNLSSNFLTFIDHRLFAKNEKLTFLDISNNRLTSIEKNTFLPLKNLKVLKLSSNYIERIDSETLQCLINLNDLHFDNNLINFISKNAFDNNFSLKKLYLNNNKLSNVLDETFFSLRKLNILDLGSNRISNLTSKTFSGLKQLKQLCLRGNCIASLEREHFIELNELKVFLIESNVISFIENDAFKDLVKLKVLTLFNHQLPKSFNEESIKKCMRKIKHFYFSHERTKLKDLLVYEKIKKHLIH